WHACSSCCFDTTKILLEHGANANSSSVSKGLTPVLLAYDLRVLKLLIAYGANLKVRSKYGKTVFDVWKKASRGNRRLGLRILMEAGYDVEPEIDRLIKSLRGYTGPGYPGRPVRGAEMKRVARKIVEIG